MNKYRTDKHLLAGLLLIPLVAACSPSQPNSILEHVLKEGELKVLTRNAATTFYEGPDGMPAGLEYELAQGFADELGIELKMLIAPNTDKVLQGLARGQAHLAAAGIAVTEERKSWLRFTPGYKEIKQQVIYRTGVDRPRDLGALEGRLEVMANSSFVEQLRHLKGRYPDLQWVENTQADSEALMTAVWRKEIDYTIVNSNEAMLNRRFYPELKIAFELEEPLHLAWAFPRGTDDSLYKAAVDYFAKLRQNGQLKEMIERHYGHIRDFDYVGARIFRSHIERRLPKFREVFEEEAERNELDWRLVAAVAYQESHWNPKAVSPTGVRGIMMLTRATARHLGIKKRTDPIQSIRGGAKYIRQLLGKFPDRLGPDDRLWMALASYNVGFWHVEDARILTQQQGGDPDKWMDVKQRLPLLRRKAWYKKTDHGYARGDEAVVYVENIRSYYDILVWMTDQERPPAPKSMQFVKVAAPAPAL